MEPSPDLVAEIDQSLAGAQVALDVLLRVYRDGVAAGGQLRGMHDVEQTLRLVPGAEPGMSAPADRATVAAELARCLVTPRQLAHLEWLLAEAERDDPEVRAMAAEVLRGYVAGLLETAPRREL